MNYNNLYCSLLLECERFKTFEHWPVTYECVNPHELAKFGFVYTQTSDIVKCVFCSVLISAWEESDIVIFEHHKWSPRCPLIIGTTRNVPINAYQFNLELSIFRQGLNLPSNPENSTTRAISDEGIDIPPIDIVSFDFDVTSRTNFREPPPRYLNFPLLENVTIRPISPLIEPVRNVNQVNRLAEFVDEEPSILNIDEPLHYFINPLQQQKNDKKTKIQEKLKNYFEEDMDEDENLINKCSICMIREFSILLLPCRHLQTCAKCTFNISKCPTCRAEIDDCVKAYIG